MYVVNRYSNIEAFFKTYLDLDNDRAIFDRLTQFRMEWSVKRIDSKSNQTNLDFLSGITIGVQPVRFSALDEARLANEVFRLDIHAIQQDFYNVEHIVKDWKVSSNVVYQMLLYMIRYVIINKLDTAYIYECYYVMAYKMITSILSDRFELYANDPRIANAVVEQMSNKFILKEKGSWQSYLEYRASFLMEGTLHYKRLVNNYDTVTAINIVNDLQLNVRSPINRIYSIVKKVGESDLKINTDTLTRMENEEMVLSDIKSYGKYGDIALERMVSDAFVNDNLIYLITEISSNINATAFKSMLIAINENSLEELEEIKYIVDTTIKTSMKYLLRSDRISEVEKDTLSILRALKSFYSSSTVRDPDVVELKQRTRALIEKNTNISTSWIITAMNINLILYIVLNGIIRR